MKCKMQDCDKDAVAKIVIQMRRRGKQSGLAAVRGPYCQECLVLALSLISDNQNAVTEAVIKTSGLEDLDPDTFSLEVVDPDTEVGTAALVVQTRAKANLN